MGCPPLKHHEREEMARDWAPEHRALYHAHRRSLIDTGSLPHEAASQAYSMVVAAYRLDEDTYEPAETSDLDEAPEARRERPWHPLCPFCGDRLHEGLFCTERRAKPIGLVPTTVFDPLHVEGEALGEPDPEPANSPADIGGPLGGWRAA